MGALRGNMEGKLFTGYSKEYAIEVSRKEHFSA
jgi:hypothetical protein